MADRKREVTSGARPATGGVRRHIGELPRRRDALEAELKDIEMDAGEGEVTLAADVRLHVTNLDKVYFPQGTRTKGDVMRYYVRAAPVLLPCSLIAH